VINWPHLIVVFPYDVMMRPFLLLVTMMLVCSSRVFASTADGGSDWPAFGGPRGDGSSPETGLLRRWEPGGPKVLWRAPIKQGWGAPSVSGNDVFICWSEQPDGERETVACLSAADGKERWRQTYEVGPYWVRNIGWARGGFRSTPAVTDRFVFTLGAIGHLFCFERGSGRVVWKNNLWDEFVPSGEKGYCFSPVLADGMLVLWYSDGAASVKEPDRRLVLCQGLRPETGEVVWTYKEPHRKPARMGEGQTPAVTEFAGETCVLVTANCQLKAIRARDGREVWAFDCIRPDGRGTTIPTPLVVGNFIVNIPDQDVAHVVEVDRKHPERPARIIWKKELNTYTAVHPFRHYNGYLYGFAGEVVGESEQTASDSVLALVCIELATGKVCWIQRRFKTGVAIIEADGLLFVRSYQTLQLVEATPTAFHELGRVHTHDNRKPTQNLTDFVTPVLSRGRLYVRTPAELICYRITAD
jgi:outer membrane protein assembly factor BamB